MFRIILWIYRRFNSFIFLTYKIEIYILIKRNIKYERINSSRLPDCGCEMKYKKIGPGYICGNGCSDREDN
mgnify:CR=1 FL=1